MSTTTDGGEPAALSDDMLHAVLAFYRLSRSLRNADLIRDLTWERAARRLLAILASVEAAQRWRRFWPGFRWNSRG